MAVTLVPVTAENRDQCLALKVLPAQEDIVSANADSLLEADQYPELHPVLILWEGQAAGFLMYSLEPGRVGLWRLMIDARFQGQGLGKEALRLYLAAVTRAYPAAFHFTTVSPENERALALYRKAGYVPTGRTVQGELELRLQKGAGDAEI